MTTAAEGHAAGIRDIGGLGDITPQMLSELFPDWHVFRNHGAWWAIRAGEEKITGPGSLLRCVLGAPDLPELAEKIVLQEYLSSLDTVALEAVWQDLHRPEAHR
jgi:hypothetical protein